MVRDHDYVALEGSMTITIRMVAVENMYCLYEVLIKRPCDSLGSTDGTDPKS